MKDKLNELAPSLNFTLQAMEQYEYWFASMSFLRQILQQLFSSVLELELGSGFKTKTFCLFNLYGCNNNSSYEKVTLRFHPECLISDQLSTVVA